MRKFIACLGFMLIPFHISGAMEDNRRVRGYLSDRRQEVQLSQVSSTSNDDDMVQDDVISYSDPYLIHNRDTGAYAFSCHDGYELMDRFFTRYFPKLIYLKVIDKIDISYLRGQRSKDVFDCIFANLKSMKLSCLWLNECDVMDKHVNILWENAGFDIKDLSLRNTPLNEGALNQVLQLCTIYRRITSIGVGGHKVSDVCFSEVVDALANIEGLYIHLEQGDMSIECQRRLSDHEKRPQLGAASVNDDDMVQAEVLSYSDPYVTDNRDTGAYAFSCYEGFQLMDRFFTSYFPKLIHLKVINKIDISYLRGRESKDVFDCIFANLGQMPHLSCLWLNECDVMDEHIEILGENGGFSITDLSLRNTPLTNNSLYKLMGLCDKYKNITSLGIGGHNADAEVLCDIIEKISCVKHLSIQLSKDLKKGLTRVSLSSMIQETLYSTVQYDNLSVYFPKDTTYKDFFTNNLYFQTKKVDISCSDNTYKFPNNLEILSYDSIVPQTNDTPVEVKCTFHMEVRYKKGDFIGMAKNIMLYSHAASPKTDCGVTKEFFDAHYSGTEPQTDYVLGEKFFFNYDKYQATYGGKVCGEIQPKESQKQLSEYHTKNRTYRCYPRKNSKDIFDLNTFLDAYENKTTYDFTYEKTMTGKIVDSSLLALPCQSRQYMIGLIENAFMQNIKTKVLNHYFFTTKAM